MTGIYQNIENDRLIYPRILIRRPQCASIAISSSCIEVTCRADGGCQRERRPDKNQAISHGRQTGLRVIIGEMCERGTL